MGMNLVLCTAPLPLLDTGTPRTSGFQKQRPGTQTSELQGSGKDVYYGNGCPLHTTSNKLFTLSDDKTAGRETRMIHP